MTLRHLVTLAAAALGAWALSANAQGYSLMRSASADARTTLVLKPDGTCRLTHETVQPRATLEPRVRAWERALSLSDVDESDPPTLSTNVSPEPLTEDEFAAKLRKMLQDSSAFGTDAEQHLAELEVTTNTVRMVTSQSFDSLKELFGQNLHSWGPTELLFENARLETDTNRLLRLTFVPHSTSARFARSAVQGWKTEQTKRVWKLVLPGKVLHSGLPFTQDNATWLEMDAAQPETLQAAAKLVGQPLVVTAEPAGLTLQEPLDSAILQRASRQSSLADPDMPITDAGPGFVAEAVALTASTLYEFPEGKPYRQDPLLEDLGAYGMQSTGTVVTAKLFAPKGRTVRTVSDLRIMKATDDQGRTIPGGTGEQEAHAADEQDRAFGSFGGRESAPARLELHLGLPAPDAQSIEELQAEAIVLSSGGWKVMTLTNVQANAQKEIDVSEVVPGATLRVTQVTTRGMSTSIQAQLEGPLAVRLLDLKLDLRGPQGGSRLSTLRTTTSGGKTTRTVRILGYQFDAARSESRRPVTLLVRLPQDLKRERVRFTLRALDLL